LEINKLLLLHLFGFLYYFKYTKSRSRPPKSGRQKRDMTVRRIDDTEVSWATFVLFTLALSARSMWTVHYLCYKC